MISSIEGVLEAVSVCAVLVVIALVIYFVIVMKKGGK